MFPKCLSTKFSEIPQLKHHHKIHYMLSLGNPNINFKTENYQSYSSFWKCAISITINTNPSAAEKQTTKSFFFQQSKAITTSWNSTSQRKIYQVWSDVWPSPWRDVSGPPPTDSDQLVSQILSQKIGSSTPCFNPNATYFKYNQTLHLARLWPILSFTESKFPPNTLKSC